MGEVIGKIDEPHRGLCLKVMKDHSERISYAPGSRHNHQAWNGGYLDHLREVSNIAVVLYGALSGCRELPFSLSDALFVLFLHDLEKPWKYTVGEKCLEGHAARERFKSELIASYGFDLTPEQQNALDYVHGEIHDFSPWERKSNELAAFVHCCDTLSARLWHDRPLAEGEVWGYRGFCHRETT